MRVKLFLLIILLCFVGSVPQAEAHTLTEVGSYTILAAWEVEPPIVGERNTLTINFFHDGTPVTDEDELKVNLQLVYGDVTRTVIATRDPLTLQYKLTFMPTLGGDYSVRVTGQLGGESVDVVVTPETVELADVLQFPDIALSNHDLQTAIGNLEQTNSGLRTLARVAIGVSIFASVIALLSIVYTGIKTRANQRPK